MTDTVNVLPFASRMTNVMSDVPSFLAQWESGTRRAATFVLRSSPFGNVNTSGRPGDYSAPNLTPADAQWSQAIESGVLPLVEVLVTRFNVVTYDSCAGHLYPPNSGIRAVPRHVGLLPRTEEEHKQVAEKLLNMMCSLRDDWEYSSVSPQLTQANIHSRAHPGRSWKTIELDLGLTPDHEWDAYFNEVDAATDRLVRQLTTSVSG